MRCTALVLALAAIASVIVADEHNNVYERGEEVVLWMNTVGPYHNRQETYTFFTLPFCRGAKKSIAHAHETLGDHLNGVELEFSGVDIRFLSPQPPTEICSVDLDGRSFAAFDYAVRNHYWYQMYLDNMPTWALVGDFGEGHTDHERQGDDTYIWTHKKIDIGYNGNKIVDVNSTTARRVLLKPGITIHFTYEINWKTSDVVWEDRFDKYLDPNFFQHRIHWFSIFNSFMMVIFLVGLVSMILMRTLRNDYARYSTSDQLDDMERDLGDEYGWKQVHGDVFRPPRMPILLSSFIGTGMQLAVVGICVIFISIWGDLWEGRSSILTTVIFMYAGTAPVNGYAGGGLYARLGGKEWIKQTLCGASLLPFSVSFVVFMINFVAIYYKASRAIPFGTMIVVVLLWTFVTLPLTMVGAVLGRNIAGGSEDPCRVNPIPRPIPEKKWFVEPWVIITLGGILPFGSIFIEMYFIFTSFWAYKVYYVYGFMLLVFIILLIVTVCVTIVCTYFLLNSEDYRWQWVSFLSSASTSVYVYLYSAYYFVFKTKMYGTFQTTFYFGYMALFSLGLGLLCGSLGYQGASLFVTKIYRNVKID